MKTLSTVLAAALLVLTACGTEGGSTGTDAADTDSQSAGSSSAKPTDGEPDPTSPQGRLAQARQDWADNGPTDYTWTYVRLCFCPVARMRIDVEAGTAVDWVNAADRRDDTDPEVRTMEDLFDLIEEALPEAETVDVRYDRETGAVRRVSVDQAALTADDEYTYRVVGVTAR